MKTKTILFLICAIIIQNLSAQELLKFRVDVNDHDRLNCPVSVPLRLLNYNSPDKGFSLFELVNGKEVNVPCQLEDGESKNIWFILSGITPKGTSRVYLLRSRGEDNLKVITLADDMKGNLKLLENNKPVLDYQYHTVMPPEGVDPIYKRSGFIHPLWSPGGEVLTRIQPEDHKHHYGIWGPWTKTQIQGREVDFMNLDKGEGTVRFANFISKTEGPVFGGFKALQQHIDFKGKGEDKIALNEILSVSAWNADPKEKTWVVDYKSTINCPLDSGILFDAYRYGGGIGFRATEKWAKNNSSMLTSDGKTRADADGTNSRWCIVKGKTDTPAGLAGVLFMSHPANRVHPEPMRIWPMTVNKGGGDVYFQFCPIKYQEWKIEKNRDYSLRYRMVVFEGTISVEEAEDYWQSFAYPPEITVIKPQ